MVARVVFVVAALFVAPDAVAPDAVFLLLLLLLLKDTHAHDGEDDKQDR